jgi:hypothetical protein
LKRGKAVAAALKGELTEPDTAQPGGTHRLRAVLVALGLGGAGYAAFKRFGGKKQTMTGWQSSVSAPPASPAASDSPLADAAAEAAADDVAASDPAEAAADATEAPHGATTPDNPVTEVDLDKR